MDKEILKAVREKVYEIEGLLELMCLRPEKCSELHPMVKARLEAVGIMFGNLVERPYNGMVSEESELASEPDEEVSSENYEAVMEEEDFPSIGDENASAGCLITEIVSDMQENDVPETEEDLTEPEEDLPEQELDLPDSDEEFYCLPDEEEDEEDPDGFEEDSDLPVSSHPSLEIRGHEESDVRSGGASSKVSGQSSSRVIPKPIFCLNDRFRFCKSLFGGSSSDFNAIIERISVMGSPEEAERYFYSERHLNPEDPEVGAFMEIVLNSFK